MFLKGKKEPQQDNFNPGVGLYDIITKLDHPTTLFHNDNETHLRKNNSQQELPTSVERKIDLNYPLHSYASGVQRVRQNRIYQELKKHISNQKPKEFNYEFDTNIKQCNKKGKLVKLAKIQRNSKNSLNESQSLYLGTQLSTDKKNISQQYLKHPPKAFSQESLELFLLRDKLQKVRDLPGPGSYELPSVFKLSDTRVQPFGKQQGRYRNQETDSSVGVGQYNIQDQQIAKSVIRFDKYSKRTSMFDSKQNSPTYYDNNQNLIPNQSKLNLEFPIAFGSTSKR